ncbi:S8 family serine peptidase [Nocardioides marmorisolisilvae]|uniref:S8 family serine peptidase n=1 Tax=Nocardioides marmorisolisilvae TaxID=1542737 RepID=UPI00160C84D0|nr:S8 family serine peptidase [Nocardioides marmorisolisilvae]
MAVSATIAVAAALAVTNGSASAADPTSHRGTPGVKVSDKKIHANAKGTAPRALGGKAASGEPGSALPAGVPTQGRYAFLIKLDAKSTSSAYRTAIGGGKAAARTASKKQLGTVRSAQDRVVSDLPSGSKVLYKAHSALAAVAVTTDVKNYTKLTKLAGVAGVYPIAPKAPTNSYAVPLQGAPQAWEAHGDLGKNTTVAIIDTGVDYTHADFGGVGTVANYQAAKDNFGEPATPGEFPGDKVIGGYDLAGDDYQADPNTAGYNPVPSPDPYPLDCNSHGSHVAGTVAGYGENSDGSTYTGSYDTNTPFDDMKIGPGMAPLAKLYAFRVFGCEGSTDLVGAAIDMAADPNGDGDPSDHVDVINMSLGSDYGSPQDGDSVATEAASALGITMVIASGNAGDIYDVGGSPGNAPSAITAAASQDASAVVDALNVSAPESIADKYPSERSIAYDWVNDPDLSGDVAQVKQASNLDGCDPLDDTDKAAVNGKIAFVEWTDTDDQRRCGSAARAANLVAAGATGFIYADDAENFAAGITGSAVIPGVLVAKSGGDAIRAELVAGHTVTIASTTANGYAQKDDSLNDTLAGFSSRGIGDPGNVKPDITAVGATVFSAGVGTGTEGLNDSGTSMATPMTAGAAALVVSQHPDWTPEQVKADLMNTAGQDLFTGTSHTGDKYAPQRVGSGRLQVDSALDNEVLAYVTENPGSVSVSFGPQAVTADTVLTKHIKVQNTGVTTKSFDVNYVSRSSVPGATYSVSPSSVTLDPRSSKTVTVTLTLHPAQMTKTIDPTVQPFQSGLPRQFQADASGLVTFTNESSELRVPVYSAPRPASAMTQADQVTLPSGDVQTTLLPLTGQSVNQGSGEEKVQSTVAGLELQGTSGLAPSCGGDVTSGCVNFSDERAADLKRFGATSNAAQLVSNGQDPLEDGEVYFAVNTQGRWRTAANEAEFDIYIDGDGDGTADAVLYNTRLPDSDDLVTRIVDLSNGHATYEAGINDSFGDTDTAVFDSDTMVMPVFISDIPGVDAENPRISYSVLSFSPYQGAPVDNIGDVDGDGNLVNPMSLDVTKPGVALFGSYDGSASPFLFPDAASSVLTLRRNAAAYVEDGGKGAMIVHFHNQLGSKTQVVGLKVDAAVTLQVAPNPVGRGQDVTATIAVPAGSDGTATGTVTLKRGTTTVASGELSGGNAQLHVSFADAGTYPLHAEYAGDDNHNAGSSTTTNLVVNKSASTVKLTVSPSSVKYGQTVTAKVTVTTIAGEPATGKVVLRRANDSVVASGTLVNGVATIKYTNKVKAKYAIRATYDGDGNYNAGHSALVAIGYTP